MTDKYEKKINIIELKIDFVYFCKTETETYTYLQI